MCAQGKNAPHRGRMEMVVMRMTTKNIGGRPAKGEAKRTYRLTVMTP